MMALKVRVVGEGYRRERTKLHGSDTSQYAAIYGRDGSRLTIKGAIVGADGSRSAFDSTMTDVYGMDSRTGIIFFLHHPRDETPLHRPIHVEVTASAPVTVAEVQWITGDPSWGTWP
jgi:hypothetical protein